MSPESIIALSGLIQAGNLAIVGWIASVLIKHITNKDIHQ